MKNFKDILTERSILDFVKPGKEIAVEVALQNEGHDFYVDFVTATPTGGKHRDGMEILAGDRKRLDSLTRMLKMLKKTLPQGTWTLAVNGNKWM